MTEQHKVGLLCDEEQVPRALPVALSVIGATALSLATWQAGGTGSPEAMRWLVLAVACSVGAVAASVARLSAAMRRLPLDGIVLMCLCAQFAALIWSPIQGDLGHMNPALLRGLFMSLAAAAVACGALPVTTGMSARWVLILCLMLHVAVGLLILRGMPMPGIDVLMFQSGACDALRSGVNPYAIRFPDPYPPTSSAIFYGQGISIDGVLQVGFPYMPLSLLMDLPAHLLGDVRYASLFSTAAAGLLIASSVSGRWGRVASAMILFSPIWPLVLFLGWTEPHVLLMLALTWFCYKRNHTRWMPIAFGLLMASKQYMPLAAPLGLLLLPRPWTLRQGSRFFGQALLTASIVTLPFVLWNAPEFINSVVLFQMRQPYRPDALSFLVWAAPANPSRWLWLPFAASAVAMLACLRFSLRRCIPFPMALALYLLIFFSLNKQAFANYYYLVIGALCCSLVPSQSKQDCSAACGAGTSPGLE